jgi:aminoglycoside phosphotransferase (APT) family kinase protein
VDALARLHATAFGDADWVPLTATVVPRLIKNDPLALLKAHLASERGEVMPARLRDPGLVLAALEALMAKAAEPPLCLLHGDMHLGNIFTTPGGRPGWYDWQTLQRGSWAMDLVYYLVGSLTVTDRQAHAPALLARYRVALAEAGGPVIPAGEAEALYRRYLAYGLFIWSVARESIVPLASLKPLLHRFATAADEAGTVALLTA